MNWTQQGLTNFLNENNIPKESYSFYKDKDDAFCLHKISGEWVICYSERGCKYELGWAKNEPQALNLLKLFLLEAYKKI